MVAVIVAEWERIKGEGEGKGGKAREKKECEYYKYDLTLYIFKWDVGDASSELAVWKIFLIFCET